MITGKEEWLEENSSEFGFRQVEFNIPLRHPSGELRALVYK